jgi:hypothetical protein
MITITSDQFEFLLPFASEWAEAKEKVVLKHGVPLSKKIHVQIQIQTFQQGAAIYPR